MLFTFLPLFSIFGSVYPLSFFIDISISACMNTHNKLCNNMLHKIETFQTSILNLIYKFILPCPSACDNLLQVQLIACNDTFPAIHTKLNTQNIAEHVVLNPIAAPVVNVDIKTFTPTPATVQLRFSVYNAIGYCDIIL